jgi:hypothetical protein
MCVGIQRLPRKNNTHEIVSILAADPFHLQFLQFVTEENMKPDHISNAEGA